MKAPKKTTHVKIETKFNGTNRQSIVELKDMDIFKGTAGKVTYLQKTHKGHKALGSFKFDGVWPMVEGDNS